MDGNGWVVIKLGGTSVSSRENWDKAAAELRALSAAGRRVLVVQSALAGVTNLLESLLLAPDDGGLESKLAALEAKHGALAEEMEVAADAAAALAPHLKQLRKRVSGAHLTGEVTPRLRAEVLAAGELMASTLGALYLRRAGIGTDWVDARELLLASPQANQSPAALYLSAVCEHELEPALREKLATQAPVVLTQGFIARNSRGETVVLGRGGSDTSAAYLAAKLGAERLEIWTDVPGLFSADPRGVSGARLLKQLDYDEAQEIATSGGKVLHPRCIGPVRAQGIPLHIRHTPDPTLPRSVIGAGAGSGEARVKAVSLRRGVALVSMETLGMWQQVGFLAEAFACFKRHGLSVDLVSTSETCVTASLDPAANAAPESVLELLLADLAVLCRPRLIQGCAAVSLVGRHIRANLHRLAPALELFEERRVHLISQAANDLNLTFVVDEDDADRLVQQLHALLIPATENDPVFGPAWETLQSSAPTRPAAPWWEERRAELIGLATQGTPCYVYDREAVRSALAELKKLTAIDRLFYAVKANPHPALLREMHAAGVGFETVSPGELAHVRGLFPDFKDGRLLFTPNFAPREEYAFGFEQGAMVTLDNLHPLREWPGLFRDREIFLRLDPGTRAGHHRHVRTAGQASKFGIPLAELDEARTLAARAGARVTGLHAHVGSGILDPEVWLHNSRLMMELAAGFPDVKVLDVGGGLGVPERSGMPGLEFARLNEGLVSLKKLHPSLQLWLEPGRYLVARAGVLLARVTQLKGKGELRYLGVDAGMNSLIRPALYGAHHEIVNLSRHDEPAVARYTVVGPICESGDVLGLDRALPESREGDVVLIANAGAYGHVMGSRYNLREPAVERLL